MPVIQLLHVATRDGPSLSCNPMRMLKCLKCASALCLLAPDLGVAWCRMEIITPKDFVGPLMELSQARRGDFVDMQFLTEARTTLIYNLPLAEASLSHPLSR